MKVIVTGASGFLGNVLCRALHKNNYEVTALALDAKSAASLQDLPIKKLDVNLLDKNAVSDIFSGQDIVFHLASLISILPDKNKSMHALNVDVVAHLAELALAANVSRFIHVSSIHAFHRFPADKIIDENRALALTDDEFDYDKTKALGELAFLDVVKKGLNGVIVNPTCFIGPYDFEPSLMGNAVNNFFQQKIIPTLDGGFNFLDVRDVAQTLINTIKQGQTGERYLLAGEWISMTDMINLIVKLRGVSGIKIKIPTGFLRMQATILEWYAKLFDKKIPFSTQSLGHLKFHRFIDDKKARQILNHQTRPLIETLKDIHHRNLLQITNQSCEFKNFS